MVTNSYLFELICEWRRWAGQRGKLLVLLIGFAIVCALLTLSLRFGQILLNANPAWLNSDNFFYTLAHQHDDGRQAPVNKLVIQTAVELPDVDQASWLSFKNVPLESSTWPIRDPLVAFYSDSFFSMTGISDMPVAEQSSGVWISERFWLEELNASPSVVGERFHHERIPHSLVVTGVLPESLNKLGSWQPDIWVPGDYLRFTTPFDANSHTMVDRFLTAVPIYFGILSSERQLNEESLNERLSAKDFAVPGMSFTTEGAVLNVYRGIELAPIERANMLAQWRLLIFLVIGLGIVLAFNTFMVFTSRFLIYQKDYQVMQVVGATPKYQLGSALFVAAAKLVVIAVISLVLLVVLERIISQHPTYKALQGDMSLGINYLQWLASWMLTSLVFLVCFLTPLIKISKKEMFDRAMGASSSKMRKLGAQGNLTLQLTVALVSLNMALTFALYQW